MTREKKRQNNTFDLLPTVHESETTTLPEIDIPPDHRFEVTLEPDAFTEEKYALFDTYQRHVHHETDADISRAGFKRFLCSSPLHRHVETPSNRKLGSYHHLYRLDGRLIAMAVLDLLPHAVSGVYFLYHPDFEKWSLGKLSALREAALALEGGYEYYYMGYFIKGCSKMKYKGDYRTQEVLDLDTFTWSPLDEPMLGLMDQRKWVSMKREKDIQQMKEDRRDHPTNPTDPNADEETDADAALAAQVYTVTHPSPLSASHSGLSVLDLHIPGTYSSVSTLLQEINLDTIRLTIGGGGGRFMQRAALPTLHEMRDIVTWEQGTPQDPRTLMGVVAELAACVGPEVAREMVVDLGG